jgi:hypothetical protein
MRKSATIFSQLNKTKLSQDTELGLGAARRRGDKLVSLVAVTSSAEQTDPERVEAETSRITESGSMGRNKKNSGSCETCYDGRAVSVTVKRAPSSKAEECCRRWNDGLIYGCIAFSVSISGTTRASACEVCCRFFVGICSAFFCPAGVLSSLSHERRQFMDAGGIQKNKTDLHIIFVLFIKNNYKGVNHMATTATALEKGASAAKTLGNAHAEPLMLRKRIGSTSYIVNIHFSNDSKETAEDKFLRLIESEVYKSA